MPWYLTLAELAILLGMFLLPTIIALRRRHPDWPVIVFHNLVLGPFIIGWFLAFVIAVRPLAGEDPLASRSASARPCPSCGTPYDPMDYRPAAPEWRCSRCSELLPRS